MPVSTLVDLIELPYIFFCLKSVNSNVYIRIRSCCLVPIDEDLIYLLLITAVYVLHFYDVLLPVGSCNAFRTW